MIKDVGCEWVVLGHSERRHVFGESDEVWIKYDSVGIKFRPSMNNLKNVVISLFGVYFTVLSNFYIL